MPLKLKPQAEDPNTQRILAYTAKNPAALSIIGKLVTTPDDYHKQKTELPQGVLEPALQSTMEDVRNIRMIKQSLPEMDTARDIMVSSILSPNNLITDEITVT